MKYIGDVSKDDASLLADLSEYKSVLEFGVGASTQIMCQSGAKVVTIDTDQAWIDATKRNFERLNIDNLPVFDLYDHLDAYLLERYEFIFVDGVDEKRLEFAQRTWPLVKPGGHMAFHDTRRPQDIERVVKFVQPRFLDIEKIELNKELSNITVVEKRFVPLIYVNWNDVEKREPWQYGSGDPPPDFMEKL